MNFSPSDIAASEFIKEAATQLTIEQEELLICLFEEAAEVTQVVAKILRFGYNTRHPDENSPTNARRLLIEVGDFLGIVDRLTVLDVFETARLNAYRDTKLAKLEDFLLFKDDTEIVNY